MYLKAPKCHLVGLSAAIIITFNHVFHLWRKVSITYVAFQSLWRVTVGLSYLCSNLKWLSFAQFQHIMWNVIYVVAGRSTSCQPHRGLLTPLTITNLKLNPAALNSHASPDTLPDMNSLTIIPWVSYCHFLFPFFLFPIQGMWAALPFHELNLNSFAPGNRVIFAQKVKKWEHLWRCHARCLIKDCCVYENDKT